MAIDLALVEEGIEIGKKMMAEMIATYITWAGRDGGPRRFLPGRRGRVGGGSAAGSGAPAEALSTLGNGEGEGTGGSSRPATAAATSTRRARSRSPSAGRILFRACAGRSL